MRHCSKFFSRMPYYFSMQVFRKKTPNSIQQILDVLKPFFFYTNHLNLPGFRRPSLRPPLGLLMPSSRYNTGGRSGGEGRRQDMDQVLFIVRLLVRAWLTLTLAVLAGVRVLILGWDVETYNKKFQLQSLYQECRRNCCNCFGSYNFTIIIDWIFELYKWVYGFSSSTVVVTCTLTGLEGGSWGCTTWFFSASIQAFSSICVPHDTIIFSIIGPATKTESKRKNITANYFQKIWLKSMYFSGITP